MSLNELSEDEAAELRQFVSETESIDVGADDLIKGLTSHIRNRPQYRKMFVLTVAGHHKFAQLVESNEVPDDGVVIGPLNLVTRDGSIKDRVNMDFIIGDEPVTLDAEVNLF